MAKLFNHETAYRGDDYLDKIKDTRILIAGCGTLGSNLAENLVRSGFENIALLDMDRVEEHNLSGQTYTEPHIGMLKVQALQDQLYDISRNVSVGFFSKKLEKGNLKKFTKGHDLVVDCFDNREARLLLKGLKQPVIHAGLYEG